MSKRDPESIAAREAMDAVVATKGISQDAVNWVYSKGFEQFRKEAYAMAKSEREQKQASEASSKRESGPYWKRIWGLR